MYKAHRPGDRIDGRCKGCGAELFFIVSVKEKLVPCDRIPFKTDGQRLLVFPDGSVARTHALFTQGHQSHWASCPKAQDFRKKK